MKSDNKKRILAIDLGRGISIPLMMLVHTLLMYADDKTQYDTTIGYVFQFIGSGTPMFLLAMGISFVISENSQSVGGAIRRGLIVLAVAYSLNFLKYIVPIVVFDAMPESFINAYGWHSPISFGKGLYLFLIGDYLQMAGFSLLFLGAIYQYLRHKYLILALALVIAFSTTYVRGISLDISGVDYLLDLLWGKGYNVYFTVFPWISFILLGMFLGLWYREKDRDEDFLFRVMFPIGFVLIVCGGILCYTDFATHFGDYYHLGFGGTLLLMGIHLWFYSILHQIVKRVPANVFFNFFYYCSKRVTTIYIIQWVVISWGMMFFGFRAYGIGATICLMPVVILSTHAIQWSLDGILRVLRKPVTSINVNVPQPVEIG